MLVDGHYDRCLRRLRWKATQDEVARGHFQWIEHVEREEQGHGDAGRDRDPECGAPLEHASLWYDALPRTIRKRRLAPPQSKALA
ncbi:MAG: hypothetical protein ACRD3J_19550, partial [Thermoanaerobaculia bacterium]